jgi:ADP-heptose:LPS heptosyltransferase
MTLPAVSQLKKKHDVLIYLTDPRWLPIIEDHPDIDVIRFSNPPGTHPNQWKGFAQFPDTDVYFQYPVREVLNTKHLTEWFCEQARVVSSRDIHYPIDVSENLLEIIAKIGRPYIIVHPYPDWTINAAWPFQKWTNLCQQLIYEGYKVIQVGGLNEEPLQKECQNFTCVAGKTSLKELATLIHWARAMVCSDSLTNHLSQAMKTRAVVIYGYSSPKLTGYEQNVNIFQGIECQPCYINEFDCSHRSCLEGISVEQVYSALMSILKE